MAASKFKLDNLIAIVDRNRLQLAGKTEAIMPLEPLAEKWRAFGFETWNATGTIRRRWWRRSNARARTSRG